MLRIKFTRTYASTGGISSVSGELQSRKTLGFKTYGWVVRASSTSSAPTVPGVAVSGQIRSWLHIFGRPRTEMDSPEIEGQNSGNCGGPPGQA